MLTKNVGEKIWGVTKPLILTPLFEMHHLVIKPFHVCSIHSHQCKHNAFFVLEGVLFIDSWIDNSNGRADAIRLEARGSYTVAPGVRHRFRTGELGCQALEMYYTEPLSEDIQRQNVGGPI